MDPVSVTSILREESSKPNVISINDSYAVSTSFQGTLSRHSAAAKIQEISTERTFKLTVFEGVNIALIVVTTWLILSLILYGIKRGRFTMTTQSSSLNNGIIYIACVTTVACLLPGLIAIQMVHSAERRGNVRCELYGKIITAINGTSLYAVHAFLWLRQRIIFNHLLSRN